MKTRLVDGNRGRRKESGTAIVIVFILLLMMAALMMANSLTTHSLKDELNRIERKQMRRWDKRAAEGTFATGGFQPEACRSPEAATTETRICENSRGRPSEPNNCAALTALGEFVRYRLPGLAIAQKRSPAQAVIFRAYSPLESAASRADLDFSHSLGSVALRWRRERAS